MADKLTPKQEAVYYVYALVDPRDNSVFYVGKGKGKRHRAHVRESRTGNGYNHSKMKRIAEILSEGLDVGVRFIAEGLEEHAAYRLEREEIDAHRARNALTNIAPGRPCELRALLDKVNFNLSRFRSREQFHMSKLRYEGRHPTKEEWRQWLECLTHFAELKFMIQDQMRERYGEQIAEGTPA